MAIKGIGYWGDEPQDYAGDAIEKLLKRMPKRLSINDLARMKKSLMEDQDLKTKSDRAYLQEWGRPMNRRELSHHIDKALQAAFQDPTLYGGKEKNPLGLVGAGLLSGVGLGVGFSLVNWGKKKILEKNPGKQMVWGTQNNGCSILQVGLTQRGLPVIRWVVWRWHNRKIAKQYTTLSEQGALALCELLKRRDWGTVNPGEGMVPDAMESAIGMGIGYGLSGKKIKHLEKEV